MRASPASRKQSAVCAALRHMARSLWPRGEGAVLRFPAALIIKICAIMLLFLFAGSKTCPGKVQSAASAARRGQENSAKAPPFIDRF